MQWILKNHKYNREQIELCGNNYLLANGYMGYRGTLEEYTKHQHAACTLTGIYDQFKDKWREPVNAPNCLYVKVYCNGKPLTVRDSIVKDHTQTLDFKNAVHKRETVFRVDHNQIIITSQRFVSLHDLHLMCMKYSISSLKECEITIETGIDGDVWDINGPHLKNLSPRFKDNYLILESVTNELKHTITAVEGIDISFGKQKINKNKHAITRLIEFKAEAGEKYTFTKYVSIFTTNDSVPDPAAACYKTLGNSFEQGYDKLLGNHCTLWHKRWEDADVIIDGDQKAQFALRFSIYHLLAVAPVHSDKISIPARGLSSQVYKGAIFWDTELYMLPFFIYNFPEIARNLVKYRINSLQGARQKAREYGYKGAFYAWESQDDGKEACTHFNVTDVFTGRPIRTYFRDKQVHISADVVYGIWEYYKATGDEKILVDGGAEVILECARFYYSYAYFKKDKNRYEILDVTTPDEHHERVNNNPYTNRMVKYTIDVALETIDLLKNKYNKAYKNLINRINFQDDIEKIEDLQQNLYIPRPLQKNSIIEQFDSYLKLEDISLKHLKSRIIKPNEYLGGPNGLATTTQIIKQADVVLLLNQFKEEYSNKIKKANWEYYEQRTEHGSSLSTCMYSMLAAHLGKIEWAYKYFMKTATIDLDGKYKQYVGTLYIGGTHPAANGGTWLAAIFGFAGLEISNDTPLVKPKLPKKWKRMKFNIRVKGKKFTIEITQNKAKVKIVNNIHI
ncbi:MAG: glycosyl hydrolase family 65 protein [Phycisphaerae bacterium]|jgi:trehalose/maltose hydrolase-like predicted phosphorylase